MNTKSCLRCGQEFSATNGIKAMTKRKYCSRHCALKGNRYRRGKMIVPLKDRFWTKVECRGHNECWPWLSITDACGYGMMFQCSKPKIRWYRAHRLSYELNVGPIPVGMKVLHRCDNPTCVNPKHLWLGTQSDNNRDRDTKGRGRLVRFGEDNGRCVLSDKQVAMIRQEYATQKVSQSQLAHKFGCSQPQVSRIIRKQHRST